MAHFKFTHTCNTYICTLIRFKKFGLEEGLLSKAKFQRDRFGAGKKTDHCTCDRKVLENEKILFLSIATEDH